MIKNKPRFLSILSILFITSFFVLPSASAHAGLVSSSPEANSVIKVLPAEVSLTFSEDLISVGGKEVNIITITNPSGTEIQSGPLVVTGPAISIPISETNPAEGRYTVNFRVVSADGHVVKDSIGFDLGIQASPSHLADAVPMNHADNENSSSNILVIIIGILILVAGVFIYRTSFN
ncbi:unannotated protein [freshwater metagenome]|uniref:Unannotated protein n=1 Tax=freshwater metagenome TaxID=449393 RepID=A0A6J7XUY0_9ZZZZ